MKANEAPDFPEKVYIPRDPEYPQSPDIWWERESSESNIEYTRTDAFIEKACDAYCEICDTKECEGCAECCWVIKFRRQLLKY